MDGRFANPIKSKSHRLLNVAIHTFLPRASGHPGWLVTRATRLLDATLSFGANKESLCFFGGGNGVASAPSSLYTFSMCKERILAAISIDFLLEIELILQGEVIHLKAALSLEVRGFMQVERIVTPS